MIADCGLSIADCAHSRVRGRPGAIARPQWAIGNPQSAILVCLFLAHVGRAQPVPSTNTALEASLAELTKPARKLPFKTVIHATTGHRVLDLNTNDSAHAALRGKILQAAANAGEQARRAGLAAARPNEAGNQLEPFVCRALTEAGLEAKVPRSATGRAQTAGYPDIEITAPVPCYLELKTYNAATAKTTQRTFYYSPSENPKVTRDALHLLLAYELEKTERGGQSVFLPVRWQLLTLQDLEVDLKFEFNQSNRGLYGNGQAALGAGAVK
jgi:hypothetical protein